jgi:maltose alpha-D-glucosyltransferase / alpha-amylase
MPGTPVISYGEEIGSGDHEILDAGRPHVLVHRADGRAGSVLFVHNPADRPCTLELGSQRDPEQRRLNFLEDSEYGGVNLDSVHVAGFRYRWIGVRRTPGG